jgi:serine/threonine-protein kinase
VGQLGKYELVAEVARGTLGIVYLAVARDKPSPEHLRVLKQLKPDLLEIPGVLPSFLEEGRLAARLDHPNIIKTYEAGSDDGRHFLVTEYVEGVTLARLFRRKNPDLTLGMYLSVIAETLKGLHHAHTLRDGRGTPLGIVHRDATPQNVFVTYSGRVLLADFGVARALDSSLDLFLGGADADESSAPHPGGGVLKAKPWYMAPEQISGDVDPRTDIFSVGVMLWEAAAGRRMWQRKADVDIVTDLMKGDIPSLAAIAPSTPPELARIVGRALTKAKEDRYPTALELYSDVEAFLRAHGSAVGLPPGSRDEHLAGVARIVGRLFAAERASVKETVDMQLAAVAGGAVRGELPSLREIAVAASSGGSPEPAPVSAPTPPAPPSARGGAGEPAAAELRAASAAPGRKAPRPSAAPPVVAGRAASRGRVIGLAIVGLVVLGCLARAILGRSDELRPQLVPAPTAAPSP